MVATRGEIPKRSETRRRRNLPAPGEEITEAPMLPVEPLDPDESWSPVAFEMFQSMAESGQRVFWQQSDWATLYMVCDQISQLYREQYVGMRDTGRGVQEPTFARKPMTGAEMAAITKVLGELGATEGARRRLRIELQRGSLEKELPAGVTAIADARARLAAGR